MSRVITAILLLTTTASTELMLERGAASEREIAALETHRYRVDPKGEALRLAVSQRGADIVLLVTDPDGHRFEINRPSDRRSRELLTLPEASGTYLVETRARSRGSYRIERLAPETHKRRLRAEVAETEAARRNALGKAEDWRAAVEEYREALRGWRELGDETAAARVLYSLGVLHGRLGEYEEGLAALERSLELRAADDLAGRAAVWHMIGYLRWLENAYPEAVDAYRRSLALRRSQEDRCGEARTLSNLGLLANRRGQPQKAREQFLKARDLCREGRDPELEATILTNLGGAAEARGELREALRHYREALPLLRSVGQPRTEAVVLNNMGQAHRRLGEYQAALERYAQALELARAEGDRRRQATVLNSLGFAYLRMGEPEQAVGYLREALPLRLEVKDRRGEGVTLNNLGLAYARLQNPGLALTFYEQALTARRAVEDRRGEAVTLAQMGAVYIDAGDPERATDALDQALGLQREIGDSRGEARTLRHLAELRLVEQEPRPAAELARRAIELHRRREDRMGEARTLPVLARAERRRGDLRTAKTLLGEALGLLEALRSHILDPDLRATFLAEEQDAFEEAIDLSMELHHREPAAGHDGDAFLIAERARARSLLEVLGASAPGKAGGKILNAREVEQHLEDGTLLLEFALGKRRSFLWVLSSERFESFELPPRPAIESAVRELYEAWSTLDVRGHEEEHRAALSLSQTLLGPVAPLVAKAARLVVVADGALHYLPFAALPAPGPDPRATGSAAPPLIAHHEILHLPSSSMLALEKPPSPRARDTASGKTVAVLADPIFHRRDPRVREKSRAKPEDTDAQPPTWPRLPATRDEARAIAEATPPERRLLLLGAAARREAVISDRLRSARVVHFATHGVYDSLRPERSGLVLSLFDEEGRPLDGFLSLREAYGLRLEADLVVLSGCQTALGREVRGEGLIGLTRAFLQAGADQVVASLWRVQERATAELMGRFYRSFLAEGKTPLAALRQAQLGMWRDTPYSDPYYWAAFVYQGAGK